MTASIVIKAAGSTNIGAVEGVDEIGIGVYAGGTDMEKGGADGDARVLLLKGSKEQGVGDFLGWPTGLLVRWSVPSGHVFLITWAIGRHSLN